VTDYPIDQGVKIPNARGGKAGYPFDRLQVTDSFFTEAHDIHLIQHHVKAAEKKLGWKFTARTVPGGVRVWRIA
jgi:hypothetical protein